MIIPPVKVVAGRPDRARRLRPDPGADPLQARDRRRLPRPDRRQRDRRPQAAGARRPPRPRDGRPARCASCSTTPSGARAPRSRLCRTASTRPRAPSTSTATPTSRCSCKARIEITADGVAFDLTGSDPQRRAPVNSTYAQTFSACAYAVKCLIDPDLPVNDGFYRVIGLDAPEGTVTNCTWPSPVVGGWETQTRLVDVIFRALLPALPERLPAGTKAMMCHAGFGGVDAADERVLLLPRDVRRRLRRPLRERRAGRRADARPEHRERAGRGDRAELPGAGRAPLARRGLGGAGPLPRRARAAQGLRLRPRDDVHRPRRPHARRAGGRVRRPGRGSPPSTC